MDRKCSSVTAIIAITLVASLQYAGADSCVGKHIGWKYQDLEDCHGFFVCYMERSYQGYCDHAEKFDIVSQKCVPGKCPPCSCNSPPLPTDPTSTELATTQPVTAQPDQGCITSPDCSIAAEGSFHRDIQDCRKYYVCIDLQPVTHNCPPGLYFDDIGFVCHYESLVACTPSKNGNCSTIIPTTTPCPTPSPTPCPIPSPTPCPIPSPTPCPTTPTPIPSPTPCPTTPTPIPSPTPCPTTPTPIPSPTPCPTSPTPIPSPTPCPTTPTPIPSPTPCPTTPTPIPSPTPCPTTPTPIPSSTPSPTSPTPIPSSTPGPGTTPETENGEVDPNIKDCLNRPNGSFVRNPEHCNIYYVCRHGDAVKHRCPPDQWFDDIHFVCNFRENVNCPPQQD